jgi:hypothetical protein
MDLEEESHRDGSGYSAARRERQRMEMHRKVIVLDRNNERLHLK